jgi:hypothetical protein
MTESFLFFDVNKLKKKSGSSSSRFETCLINRVKNYNPNISKEQNLFPFTLLGGHDQQKSDRAFCESSKSCMYHEDLMSWSEFDIPVAELFFGFNYMFHEQSESESHVAFHIPADEEEIRLPSGTVLSFQLQCVHL